MLLPPVVVDLGPDVAGSALEIVLDACNDAIESGQCVPVGAGGEESPRALAVAQPADARVLVVRIEVRLGTDGSEPSIVRELEFARKDPLRERWRSVGLAIATLVGEGEQRAVEAAAAPVPEAPPEPEPEPAEPPPPAPPEPEPPAPAEPAEEPEPEDEPVEAEVVDEEPEAADEPVEYAPLFVGLGAVTGPGFGGGAWRVGGTLRGSWLLRSGLSFDAALGATWRISSETFAASWSWVDLGLGYRFALGDALSLGVHVFGSVQRGHYEVLAAGVSRSETRYNPRFGANLDGWWRTASGFGLWTNLELSTLGRESLLFVAPGAAPVESQPIEAALMLGAGWWWP